MMNPSAYSMAGVKRIDPRYSVPSQLNTFTADGIATLKVSRLKIESARFDCPATNR